MEINKHISIAKKEFKQAIVDNKRLIFLIFSLYVISAVFAWVFHSQLLDLLNPYLGEIKAELSREFTMDPALELFINNETAGLTTYFSSVFFGIMAFVSVIVNGITIGIVGGKIVSADPFHMGLMFIALIVPHGIFEIPAMIFESTAGVLLFLFIWRFFKTIDTTRNDISSFKLRAKNSWKLNKVYLKQSVVLMVFSCVLLIIAAIIEGHVTEYVGMWVDSFFN
ncbi:stage II sporulation protein M [uncultured Methanobrevibacter sp.]|uniref:stage II sporulation protein M n=1 Tax=uncultured Methanobrevibacter sp. TaxID=253161 RepID=UPI00262AD275|nr:stage II sporulation protein M [uncultured Methanobrevibacter sp.]